jgi:hypothetical protein
MTLKERFWSKVNTLGPMHPLLKTRCWLWVGAKDFRGRGFMNINKRMKFATHISWLLAYGRYPSLCVLHYCDNPACIRPAHLHEGTQQDNMAERGTRGRTAHGEQHGRTSLTAKQVREIRTLVLSKTQQAVADQFGIGQRTVCDIVSRKNWAHIL